MAISGGLTAEYFDQANRVAHVATRTDPQLDAALDLRSSGVAAGGANDDFSVRWSGYLTAPTTGYYQFKVDCSQYGSVYVTANDYRTGFVWPQGRPSSYLSPPLPGQPSPGYMVAGRRYPIVVTGTSTAARRSACAGRRRAARRPRSPRPPWPPPWWRRHLPTLRLLPMRRSSTGMASLPLG